MTDNAASGMQEREPSPRIIHTAAPVRICDIGGWTDTWFAKYGSVVNIAVTPRVEVLLSVYPRHRQKYHIKIHSNFLGDLYLPGKTDKPDERFHMVRIILTHAVIPHTVAMDVQIQSHAPPGSAVGTSAAVAVALIGALEQFHSRSINPQSIAYKAHETETVLLKGQSGIQDQLCCAYGGINFIEITEYSRAIVHPLKISPGIFSELEERLALICLGTAHNSSSIHEKVIADVESRGPEYEPLRQLRLAAIDARDALLTGDLQKFGYAMRRNTEAQSQLHPDLVSKEALKIISIAQKYDSPGWKVNGAGGEGGSLTLLAPDSANKNLTMLHEIQSDLPNSKYIPVIIDREGLRVRE
ncbi:MAG: GHMP kinase [Bacteroidota bacterium]